VLGRYNAILLIMGQCRLCLQLHSLGSGDLNSLGGKYLYAVPNLLSEPTANGSKQGAGANVWTNSEHHHHGGIRSHNRESKPASQWDEENHSEIMGLALTPGEGLA